MRERENVPGGSDIPPTGVRQYSDSTPTVRQSDSPTVVRQSDSVRQCPTVYDHITVREQSDRSDSGPTVVRQWSDSPTADSPTVVRQSSDSSDSSPTVPTVPTARAQRFRDVPGTFEPSSCRPQRGCRQRRRRAPRAPPPPPPSPPPPSPSPPSPHPPQRLQRHLRRLASNTAQ